MVMTLNEINVINILNTDQATTCCFSGHRIIAKHDINIVKHNIDVVIHNLYNKGYLTFISGGALGFDTIVAEAVIKYRTSEPDIRLIMALPCKEQAHKWTSSQQDKYKSILKLADEVIYVSDNFTPRCMHKRNEFMVDNSSALVAYIKKPASGTAYTISYAMDIGCTVTNILDI